MGYIWGKLVEFWAAVNGHPFVLLAWATVAPFAPSEVITVALVILWSLDLYTGVLRAVEISRWTPEKGPIPYWKYPWDELRDGPRTLENIKAKRGFRWDKIGASFTKLALWLVLAVTCSTVRMALSKAHPQLYPFLQIPIGFIEFALVAIEGGSVLDNTACYTGNKTLRRISRFWEKTQTKIEHITIGDNTLEPDGPAFSVEVKVTAAPEGEPGGNEVGL